MITTKDTAKQLQKIVASIKNRPEIEEIEILTKGKVVLPGSSSMYKGPCCPNYPHRH